MTRSRAVLSLIVLAAGCGGGGVAATPGPASDSQTASDAVRNFMQAVADSNITRMSQLWGTSSGPAGETRKPEDYEKRMIITQLYLRGTPYRIMREDPVTDDPNRRLVTVELNRGSCLKSIPVTVINTGKTWIVNQIDLNLAGTPMRPCEPADHSQ